MATPGDTLINFEELIQDQTDLPQLLGIARDLARLSHLVALGLRVESGPPDDYDDEALLASVLWPLERACERAIELERKQRGPLEPLDVGRA